MKPMPIKRSLTTCAGLALALPRLLGAADLEVVVPNNRASIEGNNRAPTPFGGGPFRYQQVFAASEFSTISSGGGWVNGFTLRADASCTSGVGYTASNLQINLSTTTKAPDGLSSIFAENLGADSVTVLGASSGGAGAPCFTGSVPQPFYEGSRVQFSTPFFYQPQNGNLLMEVFTATMGQGAGTFDGELTVGDSISRVVGFPDSPTAFVNDTFGLIVDFQVTPVPEPSIALLLVIGGIPLVCLWRASRKKGGTT